jgi:ATP-dependent helicase/nuclease subunit B
MSNITLLLGPAGAGTTTEALALLAARRRGRAILLLPSKLHAERLDPQLVFLRRTGVHTFGRLIGLILRRSNREVPLLSRTARALLLRATVSELVARKALPQLAMVAHKPGFLADVGELLNELAEAECTPEALATANVSPYDGEYATIYTAYQARLAQLGVADEARLLTIARDLLREQPDLVPIELFVVDGFDQFTALQLSLVQTLAAQASRVLITLTGEQPPRPAHRRFQRTLEQVQRVFASHAATSAIRVQYLPRDEAGNEPPLQYIERYLFNLDVPAPIDSRGAVRTIAAADREREVRAALRYARQLLSAGSQPEQIAVLYRDGATYGPLLREVAAEYDLPLALYEGQALAEAPPVVALRNLLALPETNYSRRALVECWRDLQAWPLPDGPGDPVWAAALLDRGAAAMGVTSGLEPLRAALDAYIVADPPADLEAGEQPVLSSAEASAIRQALEKFIAWSSPPPEATCEQYGEWLRALLFPAEGRQPFAFEPMVGQVLDRTLMELAEADRLIGQPARESAAFISELEAALARVRYGAEPPQEGKIAVLPILAARGATFEHVIMLGLAEGEFPARPTQLPIYNRRDRLALVAAGVPLAPRDPADERSLFYEAVSRATTSLTLTRTRLDESGNSLAPSPYLHALLELFTPESVPSAIIQAGSSPDFDNAASEQERLIALATAGELRSLTGSALAQHIARAIVIEQGREGNGPYGPYEGIITDEKLQGGLLARLGPDHRWSVTQINDYTICPFRFAAAHVLQLSQPTEPEEGLEHIGQGRIYHAILAKAGKAWAASELPFTANNETTILAALHEATEAVLSEAPTRYGFTPGPFWAWEQNHTRRRLIQAVRRALNEGGPWERFRPVATEVGFGLSRGAAPLIIETDAGPALISGRIDRIDQDEEGRLAVIDYKSNSSPRPLDETVSGRDVQLTVYMLAIEQQVAPNQVVERATYVHLGNGKRSKALTREQREEAIGALQQRLAEALNGARDGHFPVRPSGDCPRGCAYMQICRLNLRKRGG